MMRRAKLVRELPRNGKYETLFLPEITVWSLRWEMETVSQFLDGSTKRLRAMKFRDKRESLASEAKTAHLAGFAGVKSCFLRFQKYLVCLLAYDCNKTCQTAQRLFLQLFSGSYFSGAEWIIAYGGACRLLAFARLR
jgi:hypothetical protein